MTLLTRKQFRPGFLGRPDDVGQDIDYQAPVTFPVTPILDNFRRADGPLHIVGGYSSAVLADRPSLYWRHGDSFSTGVLDTFNRPDETPAAGWTTNMVQGYTNGIRVTSQGAAAVNNTQWNGALYNATGSALTDCEAYATLKSVNDSLLIFARRSGGANPTGYHIEVNVVGIQLWRSNGESSWTALGSNFSRTMVTGDMVGIRCVGTSIESWYKPLGGAWTLALRVTDATYSSGSIGLGMYAGFVADDFGGGAASSTAFDTSGNGRIGTYVGYPTLGGAGGLGYDSDTSVALNGSSQYVTSTYSPFQTNTVRTFETLAYRTDQSAAMAILSADSLNPFYIGMGNGNDTLVFSANDNAGVYANFTNSGIGTGGWHHVALVFDDVANTVDLWVDGIRKPQATGYTGVFHGTPGNFKAGASYGSTGAAWKGSIDEVAVYEYGLTSDQIARHAAAASINLVTNPSFETDLTGWVDTYSFLNTFARQNGWASSGSWSLRMTRTATGNEYPTVGYSPGGSLFNVVPGELYELSADFNVLTAGYWYGSINMRLQFSDANGSYICNGWDVRNGNTSTGTYTIRGVVQVPVMSRYDMQLTQSTSGLPISKASLQIWCALTSGGTFDTYIDNVSIRKVASPNWQHGGTENDVALNISGEKAQGTLAAGSKSENMWISSGSVPLGNCEAYADIAALPVVGETISVKAHVARPYDSNAGTQGYQVEYYRSAGTDQIAIQCIGQSTLAAYAREVSVGDGIGIRMFGTKVEGWYRPKNYVSYIKSLVPLLHWRLDEPSGSTATDISGNTRDGTYAVGGNLYYSQRGATSDGNAAISYSGTSGDRITSSYAPFITGGSGHTFCAWVNRTDTVSYDTIFGSSGSSGPLVRMPNASDSVEWFPFNGGGCTWTNTGIGTGKWSHVVVTFSGVGNMAELFVNGESLGAKSSNGDYITAQAGNFWVGDSGISTGAWPWQGGLDEIALFPGVLTATQIKDMYRAGILGNPWTKLGSVGLYNGYDRPAYIGIRVSDNSGAVTNFGGGEVPGVPQAEQVQYPIQLIGNPQTVDFPLCRNTDDFSATASPLASPWAGPVTSGEGQLQSSLGNAKNSGGGWSSGYRSDTSFADGEVWATKGANSTVDTGNLMYRGSGAGTASPSAYELVNPSWDLRKLYLYKNISGSETGIYSCDIGSPLNNGDAFGARFIGSAHTFYVKRAGENWVQVGNYTDSSITSAGWIGWAESGVGPEMQDISWGGLQHDPIPDLIRQSAVIRGANY